MMKEKIDTLDYTKIKNISVSNDMIKISFDISRYEKATHAVGEIIGKSYSRQGSCMQGI